MGVREAYIGSASAVQIGNRSTRAAQAKPGQIPNSNPAPRSGPTRSRMTQRLARVVSVFGSAASTEASSPQANRPDAMVATLARVEAHLDDLIAQSRNDDETRSLALSQRLITEMSRRMQLMESGAHSAGGLE